MKNTFKESNLKRFGIIFIGFLLIVGFQNCSAPEEVKEEEDLSEISPPGPAAPAPEPSPAFCVQNPNDPSCLPTTCLFDGMVVNPEATVTAYQNSTVPFGSTCESEVRICQSGALSGSYAFAACTVSAPTSCLFDSKTIEHGSSAKAFQNSNVPFGSTCVSENRVCTNGSLSGSFAFASCLPQAASSCLFNGQTIAHDAVVAAFQFSTVPYGSLCQQENRICDNGALTGNFTFASCNVEAPQSCLFNGQTIAHGQNINTFETSTVAFGGQCNEQVRSCDNGILSGEFEFASCNVAAQPSCLFQNQTIADGQTIEAFFTDSVAFGSSCQTQSRTCSNGVLSGSYSYASCVVSPPASCNFDGQTVEHQSSVVGFQQPVAPYGASCSSEARVCDNGALSGSYEYSSCTGSPPPAGSCTFNDQLVLSGSSVKAFQAATVPYGSSCASQMRSCSDGQLAGTYTYSACTVEAPLSCSFNGSEIPHGTSVTAYKASASKKCQPQQRTCTNGSLSGSFQFSQCQ